MLQEPSSTITGQILVFPLEEHEMAFHVSDVAAVTRLPRITKIARTAEFFEGMTRLRGELAPVINLRLLLQFPPKPLDTQTRMVVVKGAGYALCVLIDRTPGMLAIAPEKLQAPPALFFDRFIQHVYSEAGRMLLILNTGKLVDPEEIREIIRERAEVNIRLKEQAR